MEEVVGESNGDVTKAKYRKMRLSLASIDSAHDLLSVCEIYTPDVVIQVN